MPPDVATEFNVMTIGRAISGDSPRGGRGAADNGSTDEEPIVDTVDANVNIPASGSAGVTPGASESAPTNRSVYNVRHADAAAPTDNDAATHWAPARVQ